MKKFFPFVDPTNERKCYQNGGWKILCTLLLTLLTTTTVLAQTFPTSCTSGDLELVSATLPPNPGESPCSCSGTRFLKLAIKNKTGSERTSFAFWGTLVRLDAAGLEVSRTPISGCKGPIAKNTSPNPFTITTITLDRADQGIQLFCDQSLKIVDLYLAWTSSNNNETCPVLTANPSTINPKCGRLPEIKILSGVDAEFTTVSATCSGGTSSITTTPFGGQAPYSYSWSASGGGAIPSGQVNSKDLTNLTPGTYTLVVTDFNNCTATRNRTITNPSALALGTSTATPVSCFGGTNGSVTGGTVSNAVGTVTHTWRNAGNQIVGTTPVVNNLPVGTYTLTVADNCSFRTSSATITGPSAALSSTKSQVNVTCFGASTGSINLTPAGGTEPYTYAWSASNGGAITAGQESVQDLSGLKKGTYEVIITDANGTTGGCTTSNSITITQPAAALALATCSKTDVTCFGGTNGTATAGAVTNSVGTINYAWKKGSLAVSTSSQATGLAVGTYDLTVSDNCSSVTCSVTVEGPAAALSMNTCSKSNVTCFEGTDGSVSAGSVSNAVGTVVYTWKKGNSTVGSSATVNNLAAGTYDLTVSDNCSSVTCSVLVGGPTVGLALGTCSKTNATCTAGGSVTAGAVTNNIGTVQYSWKNSANAVVGTISSVSNLPAGNYTLTVSDNCSTKSCSVTIQGADAIPAPSVCIVQPSLCGSAGSVTITSPAVGPNVSFSIDDGLTWQDGPGSNVFTGLNAGAVTGIKVKIGDCTSPAANCANSVCGAGLRSITNQTNNIVTDEPPVPIPGQVALEESASFKKTETIAVKIESKTNVLASPNPFSDKIKFSLQSGVSGRASLDLYNMMGQKVQTVFTGFIEAGKAKNVEYHVPASQRSNITYVFSVGEQKVSGKLIGLR
jgi:hypothetical protein